MTPASAYTPALLRMRRRRARYRTAPPAALQEQARWTRAWRLAAPLCALLLLLPGYGALHARMARNPDATETVPPWPAAPVRDLVWPAATLDLTARLSAVAGTAEVVAWSPGGRYLAAGYAAGSVLLWDRAQRRLAARLPAAHRRFVASLAWSRDGQYLASAAPDGTAALWHLGPDGALARILTVRTAPLHIPAVAFSPAGDTLAIADGLHRVMLWQVQGTQARLLRAWSVGGQTMGLSWTGDGTRLALGTREGHVLLWDVGSGRARTIALRTPIYALSPAPGRPLLAAGGADGRVYLLALPDLRVRGVLVAPYRGRPIFQVPDYGMAARAGVARRLRPAGGPAVNGLEWSPDGTLLAVTAVGVPLRVWEPARRRVIAAYPDNWDLNAIAWHPDGRTLAVAADDGRIRLLDLAVRDGGVTDALCRVGAAWCAYPRRLPGSSAPASYMSR